MDIANLDFADECKAVLKQAWRLSRLGGPEWEDEVAASEQIAEFCRESDFKYYYGPVACEVLSQDHFSEAVTCCYGDLLDFNFDIAMLSLVVWTIIEIKEDSPYDFIVRRVRENLLLAIHTYDTADSCLIFFGLVSIDRLLSNSEGTASGIIASIETGSLWRP